MKAEIVAEAAPEAEETSFSQESMSTPMKQELKKVAKSKEHSPAKLMETPLKKAIQQVTCPFKI